MPRDTNSGRSRRLLPSVETAAAPAGSRIDQIHWLNPASLVPYERNSRTHSKDQIVQIRASIDRFGFTNPILLREDGSSIGAGHGRQLASLLDPPLELVPTLIVRGLSDDEWRALIIADNKLALNAGWNDEMLRLELADLNSAGFDMPLIGFSDQDLADLSLTPTRVAMADPEEIPPAPRFPISELGDLWILGEHRLFCGDCTTVEAADAVGAAECAAIVTDPPYGIGYDYAEHDDSDNAANAQLVADAFNLGPEVRIWTPGANNLARDLNRFGPTKVLCWSKRFAAAGNGLGGASTWEPVLVVGKPPAQLEGESLRKFHSCPKPVGLYQHLLDALTKRGQAIFEPFSGSGTTLIACERSGRKARAIEISPAYVDVAILRWQQVTGQDAIRHATGETFNAMRAARG